MMKSVPWVALIRSAFLAVLGWALVSSMLWVGAQTIPAVQAVIGLFLAQPMNLITNFGVGFLIGVFALFLLERSESRLTVSQLWFLVLTVAIGMLIYEYIPIRLYRLLGIAYGQGTLLGMILGIFWSGQKYWRR